MLETIKSYLVSLGFAVDKQSYGEATKAMDGVGENVTKFAKGSVKNFAIAGVAVASFAAAAVGGIAKFLDGLGEASIKNGMLARQMWTSEQNAMSYNATLKAMGVSLQDLYLSPTLMSQFKELRKEANSLQAPTDYKEQMKLIQSVTFEFKRMKLEAGYALQWIGYYFVKYMSGPITTIKKELTSINDIIIEEMPSWTKEVAQVLSWFARFGITTVRAIKDVIQIFDDIGQGIPKNIKLIGAAIVGLGAIVSTGPIGIMIAMFTGLILLLDDFYTYLDGGESQFGPFWKKLIEMFDKFKGIRDIVGGLKSKMKEFFGSLNDSEAMDNFKKSFEQKFEIVGKLFDGAKVWAKDFYKELKDSGALDDLKDSTKDVLTAWSEFDLAISTTINKLLGLDGTKKSLEGIGGVLTDTIIVALQTLSTTLDAIADTIRLIKSLVGGTIFSDLTTGGSEATERLKKEQDPNQGYWSRFWQTTKELWTDPDKTFDRVKSVVGIMANGFEAYPTSTTPSYMYPQSSTQNNNNSRFNLSPTYNIFGNDSNIIAKSIENNTGNLVRNFSGVQR